MGPEVLNYVSPKRRRRIPWYHWIPLAVLTFLIIGACVYAWLHRNDPRFWDL